MVRVRMLVALLLILLLFSSTDEAKHTLFAQTALIPVIETTAPDDPGDAALAHQWARDVAVGDQHTCAITGEGKVRCWGDNSYGQLGDGTTQQRVEPVDVVGLPDGVAAIAAGPAHTCAFAAPALFCWGAVLPLAEEQIWLSPQLVYYDDNLLDDDIVAMTAATFHVYYLEQLPGHTCALKGVDDVESHHIPWLTR